MECHFVIYTLVSLMTQVLIMMAGVILEIYQYVEVRASLQLTLVHMIASIKCLKNLNVNKIGRLGSNGCFIQ